MQSGKGWGKYEKQGEKEQSITAIVWLITIFAPSVSGGTLISIKM